MAEDERLLYLLLNRVPFLRPKERLDLAGMVGTLERVLRLSQAELEVLLDRRIRSSRWNPGELLRQAEADRKYLTATGIGCTFYPDSSYPRLLHKIVDAPLVLYHRGKLPDFTRPTIAVVGTRRPTGRGRRAAYELGGGLARLGAITVSGLARGLDSEAHRGSLDAGGTTVAVLGNGIDFVFPRSSAGLGRRILQNGGAIVSEYPPGTPPAAYQFPARNRIINGLCRVVVVVEAPERSGALITAAFALDEGREVCVHRDGILGPVGRGARRLAEDGATVIGRAEDLAAGWGWRVLAECCREAAEEGVERELSSAAERRCRRAEGTPQVPGRGDARSAGLAREGQAGAGAAGGVQKPEASCRAASRPC
jgi:DNA processing protein